MKPNNRCYRCNRMVNSVTSKFIDGKSRWLCGNCFKKEIFKKDISAKKCANCGRIVRRAKICEYCKRKEWIRERPDKVKEYNRRQGEKRKERK